MRPALSGTWAVRPLVHRRPKLLGCCLSPLTFTTWPSLTLMTMPHPTPQYGQTLRTWLLLIGDLLLMKRQRRRLPRLHWASGQHGAFVVMKSGHRR